MLCWWMLLAVEEKGGAASERADGGGHGGLSTPFLCLACNRGSKTLSVLKRLWNVLRVYMPRSRQTATHEGRLEELRHV